ncbi:calcineurin-like phosphoesterase family protein [Brevibacillus laterosporus GI-9]|nr:calcineurin-like phosphoesterase family protein [Brevibacillus laterosporus GI-9]
MREGGEYVERIAVISDIHGNIPALEAVLNDIEKRGIKEIYCLGDLAGKGPEPEKAVDMIREKCSVTVRGNWDDFIGNPTEDEAFVWQQQRLGEERIRYLNTLPFSYDFWMSGRLIRLFHASADSVFHRVRFTAPLEERLAMFDNTEATGKGEHTPDVVIYGDVHHAFIQGLKAKSLCNTGSVGNPLDMTQPSYMILEGELHKRQPSSFSMSIVRVLYDVEIAIQVAIDEGLPADELAAYKKELRTARYRGLPDE